MEQRQLLVSSDIIHPANECDQQASCPQPIHRQESISLQAMELSTPASSCIHEFKQLCFSRKGATRSLGQRCPPERTIETRWRAVPLEPQAGQLLTPISTPQPALTKRGSSEQGQPLIANTVAAALKLGHRRTSSRTTISLPEVKVHYKPRLRLCTSQNLGT